MWECCKVKLENGWRVLLIILELKQCCLQSYEHSAMTFLGSRFLGILKWRWSQTHYRQFSWQLKQMGVALNM
ncbi:hypothetical protein LINGRAHAP2_LOCUS7578 [Linum grandiflorum]